MNTLSCSYPETDPFHEAGHAVALLEYGFDYEDMPVPSPNSFVNRGRPWYTLPSVEWDWLPANPGDQIEFMRNAVYVCGIITMAGAVAEARHSGRRLTAVLGSPSCEEDELYLRVIGHRLYPRDFGRLRASALRGADEIFDQWPWEDALELIGDIFSQPRLPSFGEQLRALPYQQPRLGPRRGRRSKFNL